MNWPPYIHVGTCIGIGICLYTPTQHLNKESNSRVSAVNSNMGKHAINIDYKQYNSIVAICRTNSLLFTLICTMFLLCL